MKHDDPRIEICPSVLNYMPSAGTRLKLNMKCGFDVSRCIKINFGNLCPTFQFYDATLSKMSSSEDMILSRTLLCQTRGIRCYEKYMRYIYIYICTNHCSSWWAGINQNETFHRAWLTLTKPPINQNKTWVTHICQKFGKYVVPYDITSLPC